VHRERSQRAQIGTVLETKYTRSKKIAFAVTSIVLSLGRLGTQLLGLTVQSVIGCPGTIALINLVLGFLKVPISRYLGLNFCKVQGPSV